MLNSFPELQEAFMYDYEAKTWKRYANHTITDDSYSKLLELNEIVI